MSRNFFNLGYYYSQKFLLGVRMYKKIILSSIILASVLSFSAKAQNCLESLNGIPFYSVQIWTGSDIDPPYVKCNYVQETPRHRGPAGSYKLAGKFSPVSGRWLFNYGQYDCFSRGEPCVFTKIG